MNRKLIVSLFGTVFVCRRQQWTQNVTWETVWADIQRCGWSAHNSAQRPPVLILFASSDGHNACFLLVRLAAVQNWLITSVGRYCDSSCLLVCVCVCLFINMCWGRIPRKRLENRYWVPIGNGIREIERSRDRWLHVTMKGLGRDRRMFGA